VEKYFESSNIVTTAFHIYCEAQEQKKARRITRRRKNADIAFVVV